MKKATPRGPTPRLVLDLTPVPIDGPMSEDMRWYLETIFGDDPPPEPSVHAPSTNGRTPVNPSDEARA